MMLGKTKEIELKQTTHTTELIDLLFRKKVNSLVLLDLFEIWYGTPVGIEPGKKAYRISLYVQNHPLSYDKITETKITFTTFKQHFCRGVFFEEHTKESYIIECIFASLKGNLRRRPRETFEAQFPYSIMLKAQDSANRAYGETYNYWIVGAKYLRIH